MNITERNDTEMEYENRKNKDIKQTEFNKNGIHEPIKLTADELLSLYKIYFDEWMYRHDTLWAQTFKLFYANLLVIVLPYVANYVGISLPPINQKLFQFIGIAMAFVFLYIGHGYVLRLRASRQSCERIMQLIGTETYGRVSTRSSEKKLRNIFTVSLGVVLVGAMFLALIGIAGTLLWIS